MHHTEVRGISARLKTLVALLAVVTLLIAACGGSEDDTTAAESTAAPEPTAASEPEPTAVPEPEPTAVPEPEPTEPETDPEPDPIAVDFDDAELIGAGMPLFESNCARCHGSDGVGTATGPSIQGAAAKRPDPAIHVTLVTDGGTNMPAFGDTLSADEINAVVAYARTFPEA